MDHQSITIFSTVFSRPLSVHFTEFNTDTFSLQGWLRAMKSALCTVLSMFYTAGTKNATVYTLTYYCFYMTA